MHLDERTYMALLGGTLPPGEARLLADHLARPCDACEAFLATRPADGLDGAADALLARALPAEAPRNDLARARVLKAAGVHDRRRHVLPAIAIAATVAVAGVAGLLVRPAFQRPAWDGEKGAAAMPVPLRLRFLVLTPGDGGPPGIERGVSGQQVPADASLQFQLELGRAAEVALLRAGASGGEVFFRGRLGPGATVVQVDGRPAAYPLAALSGAQRFVAVASEAPLEPSDLARAASAAATAGEGPPISLDVVEVTVR
jgi:hypothetical protein